MWEILQAKIEGFPSLPFYWLVEDIVMLPVGWGCWQTCASLVDLFMSSMVTLVKPPHFGSCAVSERCWDVLDPGHQVWFRKTTSRDIRSRPCSFVAWQRRSDGEAWRCDAKLWWLRICCIWNLPFILIKSDDIHNSIISWFLTRRYLCKLGQFHASTALLGHGCPRRRDGPTSCQGCLKLNALHYGRGWNRAIFPAKIPAFVWAKTSPKHVDMGPTFFVMF